MRNFLECTLQELPLFIPDPAPGDGGIPKRHEYGQACEQETNQPEDDEAEPVEPAPERRFARNEHPQRRQKKNRPRPPATPIRFAGHGTKSNTDGF